LILAKTQLYNAQALDNVCQIPVSMGSLVRVMTDIRADIVNVKLIIVHLHHAQITARVCRFLEAFFVVVL
jgi:hypothetical protein